MQGSVWGSLKCTTMVDTGNKLTSEDETLHYSYIVEKTFKLDYLAW